MYKKLFESSPNSMMLVNREKEGVKINDSALKFLGRSRKEAIGRVCHKFVCPAEKGKCPVFDLRQTIDASEKIALRKGGEKIPILKWVIKIPAYLRLIRRLPTT